MARGRFIIRALVDLGGIFAPITGAPKRQQPHGPGKRILIFNWRDQRHSYAGGAEVYAHELAKRMAADGNLVTFFCGSDGNAPRHETIDGVHIVRRGGFHLVYIWAFLYYMFRFRKRYDVIIDCHNGIPFFMPLFAREPVICILFHVHQEVFKANMSKPLAAFACYLEKTVMPRAYNSSQYVTISPSTLKDMREILGIKNDIQIIYSGAQLDILKPTKKSVAPSVVFLGRLQKYKSVDVAIHAFKKVHAEIPGAKLIIAGTGEADNDLKDIVTKGEMSKYVTFTGRVTDEQKLQLLQSSWLMVNPSFMEGWGITTIEANACATPVIGADVPGLRDSIQNGKTGLLVSYGDIDKFADAIIKLLTDDVMRSKMAKQAHAWAQNFDWDISADQLLKLIANEILPSRMARPIERSGSITK